MLWVHICFWRVWGGHPNMYVVGCALMTCRSSSFSRCCWPLAMREEGAEMVRRVWKYTSTMERTPRISFKADLYGQGQGRREDGLTREGMHLIYIWGCGWGHTHRKENKERCTLNLLFPLSVSPALLCVLCFSSHNVFWHLLRCFDWQIVWRCIVQCLNCYISQLIDSWTNYTLFQSLIPV